MSTVLIYTSPARGHLYPMMDVALALRAAGHRVVVQTLADEHGRVTAEGLEHRSISPEIEVLELLDYKGTNPVSQFKAAFSCWLARALSYHGVVAPRHRFRCAVIPEPPEPPAEPDDKPPLTKAPRVCRSRWHPWLDLLWRVFETDGLACACGRRLVLHAVVRPPGTLDVLASLDRSAATRQQRAPPQQVT